MSKLLLLSLFTLLIVLGANGQNITPNNTTPNNTGVSQDCTLEQQNQINCTIQFQPVCGYGADGLGQAYTNECIACTTQGVVSYSNGYCPFDEQLATIEMIENLKYQCTQQEKQAQICTMEYSPTCGFQTDGTSQTYGNRCQACAAKGVKYVLPGECISDN